ncbi:hypothetical protein TNCT_146751 [Trichonephila clavata]|uniref:G-patch domain-containing protein n=1 Tax=Trichonephila clavata TaxID=2740835 RepID=A0A8X6H5U9_TRICU|nr:hypothetical protein TNCT_146751 [Trichonephila clavata]
MTTVKIGRIGSFDFNPRGNLWMKDESGFGHKLLSKMGWSKGKGLGKNENGITESLKVKSKVGHKGVGWEENLPFGMDTHDFDSVLEDLNKKFQKSNGDKVKTNDNSISIEKRSHQFKNRLHYQKFIKGKDVSRYSDKDMDGIFISKTLKSEAKSVPEETTPTSVSNHSDDVSSDDLIAFKSELNMTDYFAHKLKNKFGKLSEANISSKEEPKCIDTDKKSSEREATRKKRKKELKNTKKTKEIRLSEPEIIDNTKTNLSSEEALDRDIVEECSLKISKLSEANISSKEEPKCIDTARKSTESEATRKKRKKLKNSKKTKERLSEPEIIDNIKANLSSEEVLDGNIVEECSSKISKISKVNISFKEEPKCMDTDRKSTESEATVKKRKIELKDTKETKKIRLSEPEIIDNTKTDLSSEELVGDIVEECSSKISNNKSLKKTELSDKKSKNVLQRTIQVLKSCLKNKSKNSGKFWLNNQTKNVSFNDNISYKIIEDDFAELDIKPSKDESSETFEELLNSSDSDTEDEEELLNLSSDSETTEDDEELLNFSSDSEITEDEEETRETKSCGLIDSNSISNKLDEDELLNDSSQCGPLKNSLPNDAEEDVEERPGCFDLPKSDNSNYNSWLESQRIAIKMKIYQKSLKKFKKHPVLRGTNLLEIKGYGNWGF